MRQITVDDEVYDLAEKLARRRQSTISEAIGEAVRKRWEAAADDPYGILGLFADEPELVDQVEQWAMEAREKHPLRGPGG